MGIHDYAITPRPYVFPPGTPVLRQAFMARMRDAEVLEEANRRANLILIRSRAESLEKTVAPIQVDQISQQLKAGQA